MNPNAKNEQSSGRLENAAKSVSANVTDCLNWEADIPTEAWSVGFLESAARSVPAVAVDCSQWGTAPAIWLELIVSFATATPPGRVMEHANRLIAAAAHAAPELGLTYDFTHSRTENDDVVIALSPRNATAAARLDAVAEVIRRAMAAVQHGVQVRVGGKAA